MAKKARRTSVTPAGDKKPAATAVAQDFALFRMAVFSVGLVAILTAAGTTLLTVVERQVPTALIALGSNALGMLGGLLVPRPHVHHP